MTLQEFFEQNHRIAMGFSGGVDSSYLLYAARKYGADVKAYYMKTAFQPQFEYDDAMRLAGDIGAEITVLSEDILQFPDVTANPEDRCYYCKNKIFGAILAAAKRDGYSVIIDGTNASDDADDRPGMKALKEMKVLSPLRLCGLTKDDVRALSKEAGLFTWDKPSYACLATRIPSGEEITAENLNRVERSEDVLRQMGFTDLRVRKRGESALIQVPEGQMKTLLEKKEQILAGIEPWFQTVFLDLKGRVAND
ncbi:MAG: ATP-dependent sacrificial sulfur transferase LarE [Eubacterium sp.]|nr:ATP-dependent sacrificial sulfur transferase LarE [Eubacterium sp.]